MYELHITPPKRWCGVNVCACACVCAWLHWFELLYISHIIYTRFLNVNCSLEYLLDSFVFFLTNYFG